MPLKQPKGRKVPQLISEYAWTSSLQLRNMPALDAKGCLVKSIGDIPTGSKLLRAEEKGEKVLCVFGVYRSFHEFVKVSQQLWRPYDELRNLPDDLIQAIFQKLRCAPDVTTRKRISHLTEWSNRALENQLKAEMRSDIASIMKTKKILLMRSIASDMEWPDMSLFDEMVEGFEIVGPVTESGIFKQGIVLADLSPEQLRKRAKYIKPMILKRSRLVVDKDCWRKPWIKDG